MPQNASMIWFLKTATTLITILLHAGYQSRNTALMTRPEIWKEVILQSIIYCCQHISFMIKTITQIKLPFKGGLPTKTAPPLSASPWSATETLCKPQCLHNSTTAGIRLLQFTEACAHVCVELCAGGTGRLLPAHSSPE